MPLLVLRGKAALMALRNSACALRDDAFALIRSTAPGSAERITGTPGGHSPRSTGRTHNGIRGTTEMGRDLTQWVTWKIGIVGLIQDDSMQRAVGRYIDAVIESGLKLIDASIHARGTTQSPWAECFNNLNDAINDLDQSLPHVPVDTDPVPPRVLLALIRRLIDQNVKISQPHDDGSIDALGFPDSMESEIRKRTWGEQMEENGSRHAFWLDRTTVETSIQRTTWSQRAMASLFELGIAVQMLAKGPAADDVIAAHQVVLEQPYWNVEYTEQWEQRSGRETDLAVRFPLMATERPMGRDALDRLDQAALRYAGAVTKTTATAEPKESTPPTPPVALDPWRDPAFTVNERVKYYMVHSIERGRSICPSCRDLAEILGVSDGAIGGSDAWKGWRAMHVEGKTAEQPQKASRRTANRVKADHIKRDSGDED